MLLEEMLYDLETKSVSRFGSSVSQRRIGNCYMVAGFPSYPIDGLTLVGFLGRQPLVPDVHGGYQTAENFMTDLAVVSLGRLNSARGNQINVTAFQVHL